MSGYVRSEEKIRSTLSNNNLSFTMFYIHIGNPETNHILSGSSNFNSILVTKENSVILF